MLLPAPSREDPRAPALLCCCQRSAGEGRTVSLRRKHGQEDAGRRLRYCWSGEAGPLPSNFPRATWILRLFWPLPAAEIGEANLSCITFSGAGYSGAVGQTFENAVNVDWPRIDAMANYTRTINWETGTSKETFDRRPGLNPASWKYGLGWEGGTPTQTETRQTHIVNRRLCLAHRRRRATRGRST